MEIRRDKIVLPLLLVVFGVILRIMPHMANFTPIAAIALFGGIYLRRGYALALPLATVVISDIAIGFDSLQSRLSVYGSFLLVGVIGLAIRNRKNLATIIGGTIVGSIVFYLITNFSYFYPPTMYPHNLYGVIDSYYNALPFFRNTLLGDLFYAGILFGAYESAVYIQRYRLRKTSSHPGLVS